MTTSGRDLGSSKDPAKSSSGPEIGTTPTDIAEDVRVDLEAAFARDSTRLRIKDDATQGNSGDDTGAIETVQDSGVTEIQESALPENAEDALERKASFFGRRKRRRSILEIARDYDTRIKAQADAAQKTAKGNTDSKVASADGSVAELSVVGVDELTENIKESEDKKRVVITDDTIDIDQRSLERGRAPRKRKRRFGLGNRTEKDDELSRLRKQRRASQRLDGQWRPRWYMVVGGLVVLFIGALLLLTSPLLSIKQIDVEGNVYASPNLLAEVMNNLDGDAILTADLHGAKVQLEAIAWVRKARVSMHLPSRILIQIDERSPLAFVRSADGFNRILDRDGRVLDVIEGDPVDFIRIIGTAPTLIPGDFVPQPFLGTAQLINALPRELADRLISATVSPEGEISLQFRPNLQVIFGSPVDYQAKLVGLINEIKRQGTKSYTVIDVSAGDPIVR
jgi:cell division protein FtsQ